jgi:hypothetical protein
MPRVVPALVLTATLAGLTGCGSTPSSEAADSSAASSPAPSSTAEQTSAAEQTTTAPPSSARPTDTAHVIALSVTGGNVSGQTDRVVVELGSEVRIEITADVPDEVHVHGYDLTADTAPGQPATVSFTADIPGVFEVELHHEKLLLTRLQVQ